MDLEYLKYSNHSELKRTWKNMDACTDEVILQKDTQNDKTYLMYILNSKNRNRIVPIDETIWSFHHKPPTYKGEQLGWKVEFETKDGKKDYRWETNIIDVCKYLWPESSYLFTSPNYLSKPNQPYKQIII